MDPPAANSLANFASTLKWIWIFVASQLNEWTVIVPLELSASLLNSFVSLATNIDTAGTFDGATTDVGRVVTAPACARSVRIRICQPGFWLAGRRGRLASPAR